MSKQEATDDFAVALNQMLQAKGIELPTIPQTEGRKAYLRFLASRGYQESELLPIIQREKVTPEMKAMIFVGLIQAAKSDNPNDLKTLAWVAQNSISGRDNTNLVIHEIAKNLKEDLKGARIDAPDFYAGVFPTDSFNAQCSVLDGEYLVLIDTGCMEMADSIVVSFLSIAPDEEKIEEISSAIDGYVLRGRRADATKANVSGIDFGSGLPARITNAFEEYILAHEIGHLGLGHAGQGRIREHSPRFGRSFIAVDKNEFQEFQADLWACRALIECARTRKRTDSDMVLALAGLSMGLGVALLVEASAKKHGISLSGGHPAAVERLYMLEVTYEIFGVQDSAFVGRRFRELLEKVIESEYPDASLPPMLDRDLNRKLMPVLDSLGIDFRHAPYVHDFS